MDFEWVNYQGRGLLTELTMDRILPDFKKFVLMYPKAERNIDWVITFLEQMDEEMENNYTKEHSNYLTKLSEETIERVKETKLRQEIQDSEYMDERLEHKLNIEDLDTEFTIEDALDESKVQEEIGSDEISEIELDDETYIKHIFKKYVTKTSSSDGSFSLTIEFSDEDLKRKTALRGEEIKAKEKIVSEKPGLSRPKYKIEFERGTEEFEQLELFGTETMSNTDIVSYIGESKKRIKDFIFKNKESIFEGLVFNLTARQIYDVKLEITVKSTKDKIQINIINSSTLTDRIFLKGEKINPRNLLEVRPEKMANVHLNDYFMFIKNRIKRLEKAINNIPEGI
tara:strand:+ start:260 stop:1282 length:1023 start_codon:yes stop_codon:yes gene_type:complete